MKIIFSPTKSMDFKNPTVNPVSTMYIEKSDNIFNLLSKLDSKEVAKRLKVKGNILNSVMNFYDKDNIYTKEAIKSYNGISFKQLNLSDYSQSQRNFLSSNLVILSAIYGVVRPYDFIRQYRLDMTIKVFEDLSLYKYWEKEVNDFFEAEELIVNLASKEFSKIIALPMINIHFKEKKNGEYKSISSYSKKGRGLLLNYIITNEITSVEEIKKFTLGGYSYNSKISDFSNIIFTR